MSGVGWWLSLVDRLGWEYKWPLGELCALPVAQALCLYAAILERREVDGGQPSLRDLDYLAYMRAQKAKQ